jgi:acyl carrier protein
MQPLEIYAELTRIFHDLFDNPELILIPTLTAKEVDGWDSLNHVRLVLSVQKAFRVNFTAAEINKLSNVGELVQLIEAKVGSSTHTDAVDTSAYLGKPERG